MELIESIFKQLKTGWYSFNKTTGKLSFSHNFNLQFESTTLNSIKDLLIFLKLEIEPAIEMMLRKCDNKHQINNMHLKTGSVSYLLSGWSHSESENNIVSGTIVDVSPLKAQYKLLEEEKSKAEYGDYIKTAFLANVAHDIRIPLNSISGFSEMLTDDSYTHDEKREFAAIIERNSDNLINMINDIIDVSKIEAGQIELVNTIFEPDRVLLDLFSYFQSELERHNKSEVNLKIRLSGNKRTALINCDKLRFKQVFEQLLSNAVKFTHSGTIEFGYNFSQSKYIEFFVNDTGIGIPESQRKNIFNMFKKDESVYTKPFGSNGLGLHICKNIVEMMGAELIFETAIGSGTSFSLELPVHLKKRSSLEAAKANLKPSTSGSWKGKKILVVDDIKEIYDYINLSLKQSSVSCLYASSGDSAIRILQTISDIDLILMDIQMPGMSGVATLHELQNRKVKIPVIALTAFALTGDRENFLSQGFTDYLSKPLKRVDLYKKLKSYL